MLFYTTIEIDEVETEITVDFSTPVYGFIQIDSITDESGNDVKLNSAQEMVLTEQLHDTVTLIGEEA